MFSVIEACRNKFQLDTFVVMEVIPFKKTDYNRSKNKYQLKIQLRAIFQTEHKESYSIMLNRGGLKWLKEFRKEQS